MVPKMTVFAERKLAGFMYLMKAADRAGERPDHVPERLELRLDLLGRVPTG